MPALAEMLTNSRFYVGLFLDGSQDPVDAFFQECKGFKYTQEVIEVYEVSPQPWGQAKLGRVINSKIPGNLKLNNFTLIRSLTASDTLWNWIKLVQEGEWDRQRRDGALVIYDQSAREGARFAFERAWPTSYRFSDVKAAGKDIAIEELQVVCEVFDRVPPGGGR
jgi:phage tail-like protein